MAISSRLGHHLIWKLLWIYYKSVLLWTATKGLQPKTPYNIRFYNYHPHLRNHQIPSFPPSYLICKCVYTMKTRDPNYIQSFKVVLTLILILKVPSTRHDSLVFFLIYIRSSHHVIVYHTTIYPLWCLAYSDIVCLSMQGGVF